ncbi:MAG: hypothetical protein J6Y55_10900 [Bacteroidales bacterium]|nr:hypothetical protein [Bacteroidales bacterium]
MSLINIKPFIQKAFFLCVCISLFSFCLNNSIFAQQTLSLPSSYRGSVHSWNDGELSWADFQGKKEDTSAICDMIIHLNHSEERVTKWPIRYTYRNISPRLYKLDSWVCDSLKTDLNLKYHQTVFDFSELMCRKITLEVNSVRGGYFPEYEQIYTCHKRFFSEYDQIYSFYIDRYVKEVDDFKICSNNGTIPDSVELYYNNVKSALAAFSVSDSIKNIPFNPYSSLGILELVIGYNRQTPISNNYVISSTDGLSVGISFFAKRNVFGLQAKLKTGTCKATMTTSVDSTLHINDTINSNYVAFQYERKLIDNKYVSAGPFVSLGSDFKRKISKNTQEDSGNVSFFAVQLGFSTDFHFFSSVNLNNSAAGFNSLRFSPYLQYQQNKKYGNMVSLGLEVTYVFGISEL